MKANHLTDIKQVELEIGGFSGVEVDLLEEAFNILRKGTVIEGAVIMIHTLPVLLRCRHCQSEYVGDFEDNTCPVCARKEFDVIQGRELNVSSIKGV
jgi:hydrogenase nickel incorporation protein HypA/HybF